jgi:D-inositol-3-phosphate glycosyltransferase
MIGWEGRTTAGGTVEGSAVIRRVAMLSVHTSPLDAPGGGDAGGLNVYVLETSRRLADAGIAVEVFTRATSSEQPPSVEAHPGVIVRHVAAGPFEGLRKEDLPAQLCAFAAAVLRAEARQEPGWYDIIHSHYWLSGQVGWLARDRWGVPLVHAAHTLGRVKNASLAVDDTAEPFSRIAGEQQVVLEADRLVASTDEEARDLVRWYGADPTRISVVPPGVDLATFTPQPDARERLGLRAEDLVLLFVGRIQPLKAPDLLLLAAAALRDTDPDLGHRLRLLVLGAPSGTGLARPEWLADLAERLGLADRVTFVPPVDRATLADYYRASDLTVVPSYNESFGLVALESEACGTPVVAAGVGGLPTAVADGVSGVLVDGHDPQDWADVIGRLLRDPAQRAELARGARAHAGGFSWERTTDGLLRAYRRAVESFSVNLPQAVGD